MENSSVNVIYRYDSTGKAIPVIRRREYTPLTVQELLKVQLPEPPGRSKKPNKPSTPKETENFTNFVPFNQTPVVHSKRELRRPQRHLKNSVSLNTSPRFSIEFFKNNENMLQPRITKSHSKGANFKPSLHKAKETTSQFFNQNEKPEVVLKRTFTEKKIMTHMQKFKSPNLVSLQTSPRNKNRIQRRIKSINYLLKSPEPKNLDLARLPPRRRFKIWPQVN